MDRERIKKQGIIFLLTICIVCGVSAIGIVLVQTLQVSEQVLIVRYEDTESIQEAEKLGVDFLEVGELMTVPLGDDRYRVGAFVTNPNKNWIAQSFEYNVIADTVPQRHIAAGVSSVGMAQDVLLVADVFVDEFALYDVAFVIHQVDWEPRDNSRAIVRVRNPIFEYGSRNGTFFVEVSGTLVNDSDSFVHEGSLGIIGTDTSGDTTLLGETKFYSLHPSSQQHFTLQYEADEDVVVHDIRFVISSLE
ncbi:MAG: hypothetical protein F4X82_01165 [Candidatus Spechtbacteria bacterium SB0662_bin_43]|uniref:Uncharacterized protein n=1 Tax=Candidatus Spechtbacteria bacterium SB0662_bin_43 TaxID=2604897 RepID=A0A845DBT7_9BACT|nr:hypothetical protein [Candidatus Spechtbacteria bacterium SB0662_bin_43]